MKRRESTAKASTGRFSCLTEMSVTVLFVGALGLSTRFCQVKENVLIIFWKKGMKIPF